MKQLVIGILVGAGLVTLVAGGTTPSSVVFAHPHGAGEATPGGLMALTSTLPDGGERLLLVDPARRVVSVYHIDAGGEIALKSVRNVHWDLQMTQFNAGSPLPDEIRSLLEQR